MTQAGHAGPSHRDEPARPTLAATARVTDPTAATPAEQTQATAKLMGSAAGLATAAETVTGLTDLVKVTSMSGRTGKHDLS